MQSQNFEKFQIDDGTIWPLYYKQTWKYEFSLNLFDWNSSVDFVSKRIATWGQKTILRFVS